MAIGRASPSLLLPTLPQAVKALDLPLQRDPYEFNAQALQGSHGSWGIENYPKDILAKAILCLWTNSDNTAVFLADREEFGQVCIRTHTHTHTYILEAL
jgi:hypothetical protein